MELAYLYRNVLKYLEKSSSPVHHRGKKLPPFFFKDCTTIAIVGHELACNLMPPDVFSERPCAKDT